MLLQYYKLAPFLLLTPEPAKYAHWREEVNDKKRYVCMWSSRFLWQKYAHRKV